jgi:hypothetical protein
MGDYVYYLTLYLKDFNHKSLLIEEAKKKTKFNKIYRKPLPYLPGEFISFLIIFKEYPDYFIEIPDYHHFKLQFLKNILLNAEYYRFELLYRFVWNKLQRIRISIVGFTKSLNNPSYYFFVIRNFVFTQEMEEEYALSFEEAFKTFFEYI